jgi:peroxiredoxin
MIALLKLPAELPQPTDDGACDHLTGMKMPQLALSSTFERMVDLNALAAPRILIYCYPRTGQPDKKLPEGWDAIPSARGCTPQACGFRDHYNELRAHSVDVFGLSTQSTNYQQEVVTRLHLPFEMLSDEKFQLCDALRLPTFFVENQRLIKRLTMIIRDKKIEKVFYPVFPPDEHAAEVIRWLDGHAL